jgi:DNA replicative helicase MCM subunit Mcm2 (Cdc46/Mcm family)
MSNVNIINVTGPLTPDLIGKMIRVEGRIENTEPPTTILKEGIFKCPRCGEEITIQQRGLLVQSPVVCQNADCGNKRGFILLPEKSKYYTSKLVVSQ